MKLHARRILLSAGSLLYGGISFFWMLYAIAFLLPESGPGSKEWEEDRFFIPWGIGMALLWLGATAGCLYRLRVYRRAIALFLAGTALGGGIALALLLCFCGQ